MKPDQMMTDAVEGYRYENPTVWRAMPLYATFTRTGHLWTVHFLGLHLANNQQKFSDISKGFRSSVQIRGRSVHQQWPRTSRY
jgi:hypothetical protein